MESLHLCTLPASLVLLLTVAWSVVVCQKKRCNNRVNSSHRVEDTSKNKANSGRSAKKELEQSNVAKNSDKKSGKEASNSKPAAVSRSSESGDKIPGGAGTIAPDNTPQTASTVPTETPADAATGSGDATKNTKPLPTAKIGAIPEDGRPKIERTVVLSLRHKEHDTGLNVGSEKSKKSAKELQKEKKEESLKLDQTELSVVKDREDKTQSPNRDNDKSEAKEEEVDAME